MSKEERNTHTIPDDVSCALCRISKKDADKNGITFIHLKDVVEKLGLIPPNHMKQLTLITSDANSFICSECLSKIEAKPITKRCRERMSSSLLNSIERGESFYAFIDSSADLFQLSPPEVFHACLHMMVRAVDTIANDNPRLAKSVIESARNVFEATVDSIKEDHQNRSNNDDDSRKNSPSEDTLHMYS